MAFISSRRNAWPSAAPDGENHVPATNAETLPGKTIYVSSGTGAPGEYDNVFTPSGLQTAIEGGPLEALANTCTQLFEARLGELSIPAVFAYRNDRKSTRLNSSHITISYAVFCLKKKKYKTKTL